jgi:uncharacterized protein (DUF983 family)
MRLGPVLRQRCPRCLRGKVFSGLFRMRPACPECGLRFEREPGYFLGAMYYSYAIAIAAGAPPAAAAFLLGWSTGAVTAAATVAVALASPLAFRLSRVLWLHMDQAFDPR